jgi:hypothetical protein
MASLVSGAEYVIFIKDIEGSMLVNAHESTVYALWRIKSKAKQILTSVFPKEPNLNSTKPYKTLPRIREYTGRFYVIQMRKGMRRAICAVYVESWEDRLYYRKHNGIVQFY